MLIWMRPQYIFDVHWHKIIVEKWQCIHCVIGDYMTTFESFHCLTRLLSLPNRIMQIRKLFQNFLPKCVVVYYLSICAVYAGFRFLRFGIDQLHFNFLFTQNVAFFPKTRHSYFVCKLLKFPYKEQITTHFVWKMRNSFRIWVAIPRTSLKKTTLCNQFSIYNNI